MNKLRRYGIFLGVLWTLCGSAASHVGFIYPAGGRAGETLEVVIGGKALGALKEVIVDDGASQDIIVENVETVPALFVFASRDQRAFVTKWVRAVYNNQPGPKLPEDTSSWDHSKKYWFKIDQLSDIQFEMVCIGLFRRRDPLQMSPSINQRAIVRLKIAPDAKPGMRRLRFIGAAKRRPAMSNPIPFYIGAAPEFCEARFVPPPAKTGITTFTIPGALNGQIMPGETDRFKFHADIGQEISFTMHGRRLLPFLGDGVPGHFQPVLAVLDPGGREVAFADDEYFDPDPVLRFKAPSSGTYTLLVRDALFRGRDDFVYRIDAEYGLKPYAFLPAPHFPIPKTASSALPENRRTPFPSLVSGTVGKPQAVEKFEVQLDQGQEVVLEVFARRLKSPLDSILKLYGPDGDLLAVNDDFPRPKVGMIYHHADSYLRFTAPKSGVYRVELSDTSGAGGADYRYVLRVDRPRPDFRVYVIPSGIEIQRRYGNEPLGVVVERLDGHRGDIELYVKTPGIFSISGSNILPDGGESANAFESVCGVQVPFPDCGKSYLTLTSDYRERTRFCKIEIFARSGEIEHPVIPADETMQAFAYNHLIPSGALWGVTMWRGGGGENFAWPRRFDHKITIAPGGKARLSIVKRGRLRPNASCGVVMFEPLPGMSVSDVKDTPEKIEFTLNASSDLPIRRFPQIFSVLYEYDVTAKDGTVKRSKNTLHLPTVMIDVKAEL